MFECETSPIVITVRHIRGPCIERYRKQVIGTCGLAEDSGGLVPYQPAIIAVGDELERPVCVSERIPRTCMICVPSIWGEEETLWIVPAAIGLRFKIRS